MLPVSRWRGAPPVAGPSAPPPAPSRAGALSAIVGVRAAPLLHSPFGYGLLGSRLEPFYIHTRNNPHRRPSSCRQFPVDFNHYPDHGSLELRGLQLLSLSNDPIDAVFHASGALFLATVKAERNGPDGKTALIERIVLPTGGSGVYAGLARSASFTGDIVMSDSNEIVALALNQVLHHRKDVMAEVAIISDKFRKICRAHEVGLNENTCIISGAAVQIKKARFAIRRYLEKRAGHRAQLFPPSKAPQKELAKVAATIWVACESAVHLLNLQSGEPWFDGNGELVCPITSKPARIIFGGREKPPLFRRAFNLDAARQVMATTVGLLNKTSERADAPMLNTRIDLEATPFGLLRSARRNDLVLLDDRFHAYARADNPRYFARLGNLIRTPWENGARILLVASRTDDQLRGALSDQGLFTRWAPKTQDMTAFSGRHLDEATATGGYILATNFDPSSREYDLLPLPPA